MEIFSGVRFDGDGLRPGLRGNWSRAFYSGGRTASGERTGPNGLTAAHRTLPFGTMVLVTNVHNGKAVVVRIVDRGPYRRGRIIDVSRAAARELDMIDSGIAMVSIKQQTGEGVLPPINW